MRIFVDSNILISAALNAKGTPYKAFLKAVTHPNKGIICDQNIEELRRIFNRKFPDKINILEHFLAIALLAMEVVPTPKDDMQEEFKIRDVADRPILRAAIYACADILLTGDKDFLESSINTLRIMSAAEFLNYEET